MPAGLIDTHSHLDCPAFDKDRAELVHEARTAGVTDILVCAGFPAGFEAARSAAHTYGLHYAAGIHPLFLPEEEETEAALTALKDFLSTHADDPRLAAVGEIGLDGYIETPTVAEQLPVFAAQLKLAAEFDLPVSIHARHAVDVVSAAIRKSGVRRGVIHAFNGSSEQAKRLIDLGFKLGFGGALMYTGSKRIRRIFAEIGDTDFVLETDAPDMPSPGRRADADSRTHPADIALYCEEAARIRGVSPENLARLARESALAVFSRMAA